MQCWMICVTENAVERIVKMDSADQTLQFIGQVIVGNHPGTTIQKTFLADLTAVTLTEQETYLNGQTLSFRDKTV